MVGCLASRKSASLVAGGSAIVAGSVLIDSTIEHYRGSFAHPAMVLPLVASALSFGINANSSLRRKPSKQDSKAVLCHAGAIAVGLTGLAFHTYNIIKHPGRLRLNNFFYQAPIGSPAALILAGTLGTAADALAAGKTRIGPVPLLSGRLLAGYAALGIAGTTGEAALLHFRGAYHNTAMWLPVTLPPLAALSLARDAIVGRASPTTTTLLTATAAIGLVGTAFHAFGVSRNMGGWKNWRQNLLVGPPLPAPPAFTGLAIVGLGALLLLRRYARG